MPSVRTKPMQIGLTTREKQERTCAGTDLQRKQCVGTQIQGRAIVWASLPALGAVGSNSNHKPRANRPEPCAAHCTQEQLACQLWLVIVQSK